MLDELLGLPSPVLLPRDKSPVCAVHYNLANSIRNRSDDFGGLSCSGCDRTPCITQVLRRAARQELHVAGNTDSTHAVDCVLSSVGNVLCGPRRLALAGLHSGRGLTDDVLSRDVFTGGLVGVEQCRLDLVIDDFLGTRGYVVGCRFDLIEHFWRIRWAGLAMDRECRSAQQELHGSLK